jgi:hypothetical protein
MSYAKTSNITIDFDSWIAIREKLPHEDANWHRDVEGMRYLDHKCNFSGFLSGPIATWKGHSFNAVTKYAESIDEFVFYCEEVAGNNRHIFLYDLFYNIGMPQYFTLDISTFDPVLLDKIVEYPKSGWKVRYGQV